MQLEMCEAPGKSCAECDSMDITAKYVSACEAGDYFQISFGSDDPDGDDRQDNEPLSPYLIVQRQFDDEDDDDQLCYVETHDEDYCGHFRLRLIEFSETRLTLEILRRHKGVVTVNYRLLKPDFEATERVIKVIFGDQALEG
jgi:hypothetical protein